MSFSLEWNGLKYVFGGDTYPNKWYMEFAAGADVASHESVPPARGAGRLLRLGPGPGDLRRDPYSHRAAGVR